MPDEPEVDSDALRDTVKEEMEKEGGSFLRRIALTTALLAACAAIASLKAGDTVNEALVFKTEATQLQAQASDQWAYYQAKGIKSSVQEASRASWEAIGKVPPPAFEERQKRYADEQTEIKKRAEQKEHELEAKTHEAEKLLEKHHGFAGAVALIQVAIALGAVSALTRNRWVWLASIALGAAGVAIFLMKLAA
jgi:hypothetical protein